MKSLLGRINLLLDRVEEWFLLIGIAGMGVIMTTQVFSRMIFGASIVWSEELTRHIFIWTIFIGMSYGISKYTHVNLDYFIHKFSPRLKQASLIAVDLIVIIMLCTLFVFSIIYVADQMEIKAPAMGYPMGYVMAAMPVSSVLAVIRLLNDLIKIAAGEKRGNSSL